MKFQLEHNGTLINPTLHVDLESLSPQWLSLACECKCNTDEAVAVMENIHVTNELLSTCGDQVIGALNSDHSLERLTGVSANDLKKEIITKALEDQGQSILARLASIGKKLATTVKDKIFSYKARVRRMLDSTKSKLNQLKSEIDVKLAIRKLKNHRVRCTRQEYDDYINKLMVFRKDIISYANETLDIVKHVEKMLTGSVSDSDVAYVNNKTDVLNDLNMKCLDRSNELSALKDNLNAEEGESSKTLAELGYTDSDLDRMIKTNEELFRTFDLLDDSVRKLTELNNKLVAKAKQNGAQTTEDLKTVGFGAGIMLVGNIPTAVILTVGKLCGNAPLLTNSWASAIALPFFIAGVIVAGLMSIGSVIVGGQVIAD